MKNLLLICFTLFLSLHLSAQDTLYVEGKKEPVLVNVVKVKNTIIRYTKYQGNSDKVLTIKRNRIERIGFEPTAEQRAADLADLADLTEPYVRKANTVYLATRGLLGLPTVGLYYDRSFFTNENGNLNIGGLIGGGLVNAGENDTPTTPNGQFIEAGGRLETGKGRLFFHSGLNVRKEFYTLDNLPDDSVILGIPFGATFRSSRGAYMSAGGELNSKAWAEPLFRLRFGWSF